MFFCLAGADVVLLFKKWNTSLFITGNAIFVKKNFVMKCNEGTF